MHNIRNPFRLLLALLLALLALASFAHSSQQTLAGPNEIPSNAKLQDLLRRTDKRRSNLDARVYEILHDNVTPDDWRKIERCRKNIGRKRYDELASDRLHPQRCRLEMWCPHCNRVQFELRRRYQIEKLRSVSPADELRAFHLVFTIPDILFPIVRLHPAGREAHIRAAWSALHRSFESDAAAPGERGSKWQRRAFSENFGAIINAHWTGDQRTNKKNPNRASWPVFRPHLDCLLAGYRVHENAIVPLPEGWPCGIRQTGRYYREALREEFAPLLGVLPMEDIQEAHHYLQSEFPAACWVTPSGKNAAGKTVFLHKEGQVVARVEYSAHPLFDPGRMQIKREDGQDIVYYPTQGGRALHRVPAFNLFRELREFEEFAVGKKVHRSWGFLSRGSYSRTCELAGTTPVVSSPKSGARLIAVYYPDAHGVYDAANQVIRPRRAQEEATA